MCDDRLVSSHGTSHQKRPAVVGSCGPFSLSPPLKRQSTVDPEGGILNALSKKKHTHTLVCVDNNNNNRTREKRKKGTRGEHAIRVYSVCLICHSKKAAFRSSFSGLDPASSIERKTEWSAHGPTDNEENNKKIKIK